MSSTDAVSPTPDGWQDGAPPTGVELEFTMPDGRSGRGRLIAMKNGGFALETPHADFTGRDTFFHVRSWRHAR